MDEIFALTGRTMEVGMFAYSAAIAFIEIYIIFLAYRYARKALGR